MNNWTVKWDDEKGETQEQGVSSLNDALVLSAWLDRDGTHTTMSEDRE